LRHFHSCIIDSFTHILYRAQSYSTHNVLPILRTEVIPLIWLLSKD
jgi:hypothetical protein